MFTGSSVVQGRGGLVPSRPALIATERGASPNTIVIPSSQLDEGGSERAYRAITVAATLAVSAGGIAVSTAPAQAGRVVLIKGISGDDVILMARKGRKVLAVSGRYRSEYSCYVGRIYWDGKNSAWKIRVKSPSPYEPGKIYRDVWETTGNYKTSAWHLNRFTKAPWTSSDYRVFKKCRKEIKSAGLLPSGL